MARPLILAVDQGTTSSRALVVDVRGAIVGAGQQAFKQHFPEPGRVEHDPLDIWSSTQAAILVALKAAGAAPREIAAIGVTNQRETVLLWDRATGEPAAPAIVWQDRRTAARCDELRAAGHEEAVREATGLTLDPYFSGTKLAWLLEQDTSLRRRAERGELAAGTVDSWLIWQLTGGRRHVTDSTNACRTLLFNLHSLRWDDSLLGLFGVPAAVLPEVLPSSAEFGETSSGVFGARVPILAVAGDQQSALFGQACFEPGQAKNTYGTGCFLLANAGSEARLSEARLLTSVGAGAAPGAPEYVLEGSVFVAGSLVQWLRDGLGIIERSEDVEALAASVPDSDGVTVVPAFTGLGAPYWDPYARGTILGLTRGTTRAHIARAALEAIALANVELLEATSAGLPAPVTELRVDGGAARNNLLMQIQADFLGIPVVRPTETETTALGAAYLAGLGSGAWASRAEVGALWRLDRRFEPALDARSRADRLAEWRRAVQRSLDWARA